MKKRIIVSMFFVFTLLIGTNVSAASESVATLKTQIAQLNKQIATLKNENAKLKRALPKVTTGQIYHNGIPSGSSNFITMIGKNYVEVDSIIPALTRYTDQNFNYYKNNLYLGIKPIDGAVSLTKIPVYNDNNTDVFDTVIINNKIYPNVLRGWYVSFGSGASEGSITYKIDSKYTSLKFLLGVPDSASSDSIGVTIYGDDNVIYTSSVIRYLDDAIVVDVNVQGYKYIRIKFNDGKVVMATPVLIP